MRMNTMTLLPIGAGRLFISLENSIEIIDKYISSWCWWLVAVVFVELPLDGYPYQET